MSKVLVLSEKSVAKVLDISDAIEAVEGAYRQKAMGEALAWPMVYEEFEPGAADMDIRSGRLVSEGLFGMKLTSWFSSNPSRGLPEVLGTSVIFDDKSGEPLSVVNAAAMTGLRTGAAGALGVKWLARKDSSRLLVCGAGAQSAYQVAATLVACPNIRHVDVWNPRSSEAPTAQVARISDQVGVLLDASGIAREFELAATADGEGATRSADAIITVTPAFEPFLMDAWVQPGTHISCVGADMPGKQEIESSLCVRSHLVVDDVVQSLSSGELEVPTKEGLISRDDIICEIGQVIDGSVVARTSDDDITVFDTSGLAIQDLAASKMAYDRAVERGIGTYVEL
ncbi:MAG: ornithine cyclodeaminase [Atopobiaceae bacterium]|nr:ornithine cyclodeaminase [Atopobiaceae bacterium]MCI2173041.1 ornithine cyclodeaminase [Atopobiaceae bacterium]